MRQDIAINLATPHGARRMVLQLDEGHFSQRFMLNDFAQGRLYEAETSNFLGAILRPGDVFIDIGAHVGYFSMLAAALVGDAGEVWSFEPEPRNFAHLLEHIEVNAALNVRPMHMAVGAAPAIAEFFVNVDNDGGHALWEVGRHPFNERSRQAPQSRKVYVSTLDQLFAGRDASRIKAIKIDAEGAEFAILVGARELLRRHPVPFIVAEINTFALQSMGVSEHHLRSLMTDAGYETYLFAANDTHLQRLQPHETPQSDAVYNVVFRHPEAPALAA